MCTNLQREENRIDYKPLAPCCGPSSFSFSFSVGWKHGSLRQSSLSHGRPVRHFATPQEKGGLQEDSHFPQPRELAKSRGAPLQSGLDPQRSPQRENPGQATNSIISAFLFCKKIIDLPGGQINEPSSGKTLFSVVPPSNSLISVSDP